MKELPLKPSLPQHTASAATGPARPNAPTTGPSVLWQGRQVSDAYATGQSQTTEQGLSQAGGLADLSLAKNIQQKMRQQAASGAQNPPSYVWEQKTHALLQPPKGLGTRLSLRLMPKGASIKKAPKSEQTPKQTPKGSPTNKRQKTSKALLSRTSAADDASAR